MRPETVSAKLDRATQFLALIGFAGLLLVAMLTFYDGAARYLFAPRISGFIDYGQVVFAVVIASCFPAVLMRGRNLRIAVLDKVLGPRMRAVLETFGAILTLAFFSVMVWQFYRMSFQFFENHRVTETIGLPLGPWWLAATILITFCVPVQLWVTGVWLHAIFTGREPRHLRFDDHGH